MSSSSYASATTNLKDSSFTKKLSAEEEAEIQRKNDEKRDIEFRKALQTVAVADSHAIKSRNQVGKMPDHQIVEALNELGLKVLTKNTLEEFIKDAQFMTTVLDDSLVCSIDDVKRILFDSKETQNVREKLRIKYQKEYITTAKEHQEQQTAAVANEHYAQLLKKQQQQNAKLLQQQQMENTPISRVESPTTILPVENVISHTPAVSVVQPKRTTAMSLTAKKTKEEFIFDDDEDLLPPAATMPNGAVAKKQDESTKKKQSNNQPIVETARGGSTSSSQPNLSSVEPKKTLMQKMKSPAAYGTSTSSTVSTSNMAQRTPIVVGDDFSIDKFLGTNSLEIFPIDPDLIKKEPILIRLIMGIMLEITNSIIKNHLKRSISFRIENTIADGKLWNKCKDLINRNPKYRAYIKTTNAYEGEQVALLFVDWSNGPIPNGSVDSGTESD